MKKIFLLLLLMLAAVSCMETVDSYDPQPVPEPQDPPALMGKAFTRVVSFTANNKFSEIVTIPKEIVVYPSDIVLVYLRWSKQPNVWRLLPTSKFFTDGGELQYSFDFTTEDVSLFLTGDINLYTLGPKWTDHQVFRVVVMPATMAQKVDINDMKTVMNMVKERGRAYGRVPGGNAK